MDRVPEPIDATRRRVRQRLDDAGVPRWAQQGSLGENESASGCFYTWGENGTLHGCLVVGPHSDRAAAIGDLLHECDRALAQDETAFSPNADLTQLAAVLIVRPTGFGSGSVWRSTDLHPLQNLLNFARAELARRR